jgi:hypothetical protein
MTREEVHSELEQARSALDVVANHFQEAEQETQSPLGALYFAVHHLCRAVEKLAAEKAPTLRPFPGETYDQGGATR